MNSKIFKKIAVFAVAAMAACVMLVANPHTAKADVPGQVTGVNVKLANHKYGEFYISWTPQTAADGYVIEAYDVKNRLLTTKTVSANYFSYYGYSFVYDSKLANKTVQFRVRAYYYDDNAKEAYAAWSNMAVAVPNATISKILNKGNGTVTVKWKKVSGAKSYTVYKRVGTKGKFKKVKTVSGTSCAVSGLKNNKEAGFIVVANNVKVNGKKYSTNKDVLKYYTSITYRNNTSYWK
jgi:hypothetical protein